MPSPRLLAHRSIRWFLAHRSSLPRHGRLGSRDERGEATVIWCLGLAVLLLPLGGISLDLWHGISDERALQSAAASAAAAGSSGIDQATYRQSGTVTLDPSLVQSLVAANLSRQSNLPAGWTLTALDVDANKVTVELKEPMPLTLLRVLLPQKSVTLTAVAESAATPSGAP